MAVKCAEKFDLIVSNPTIIGPSDDTCEGCGFELSALGGGQYGLADIER